MGLSASNEDEPKSCLGRQPQDFWYCQDYSDPNRQPALGSDCTVVAKPILIPSPKRHGSNVGQDMDTANRYRHTGTSAALESTRVWEKNEHEWIEDRIRENQACRRGRHKADTHSALKISGQESPDQQSPNIVDWGRNDHLNERTEAIVPIETEAFESITASPVRLPPKGNFYSSFGFTNSGPTEPITEHEELIPPQTPRKFHRLSRRRPVTTDRNSFRQKTVVGPEKSHVREPWVGSRSWAADMLLSATSVAGCTESSEGPPTAPEFCAHPASMDAVTRCIESKRTNPSQRTTRGRLGALKGKIISIIIILLQELMSSRKRSIFF
ncbi:hypothetical protein BU23DRAFT_292779 [Bimuria novae-zelandiae CBS 107.79]|uniref:Uncharacterized protein n=1 Tax=Bimuria novae-zelandiae CBS 107.79 TaxID=1447943 RepID=A0A6A5UQX3_9PLEO|nr:hypothetical protein BU23DRAFT_292779 [Bimuria novae-zelandiae CBS 107.79]